MRYSTILLLSCCLSTAFVTGGETTSGAGSRILDGTNVPASQFPTVGEVGDANSIFCTGTLIAPNVVLCAGHCVSDDNGTPTLGDTAGRVTFNGKTYRTKKIVIHPTYRGFAGTTEGQFDVSLMFLDQDAAGITPTPLYRQKPALGQTLTLAGYGSQGTGTTGPNDTFPVPGTINFGATLVDSITNTFVIWRFDTNESNTGPGDSGGPAFVDVDGVRYIAGVTSGGTTAGAHGDVSFDVRVDAVAAWIDEQIKNGGTPTTPPTTPPTTGTFSFTSLPAATPNPAQPRQEVQLFCGVNAAATFEWDFGDGSSLDDDSGSVTHTFNSAGTYAVFVTATNTSDGSRLTGSVTVTVGNSAGGVAERLFVTKGRFTVNFQNPERSKLDVTLSSSEFRFFDRFDYDDAIDGEEVRVLIGGGAADELYMDGTTGFGYSSSSLRWNLKKGEIRYQLRGSDVLDFLEGYGVTGEDSFGEAVTVPFELQIAGNRFAGDYTFNYRAKGGRTGTGK